MNNQIKANSIKQPKDLVVKSLMYLFKIILILKNLYNRILNKKVIKVSFAKVITIIKINLNKVERHN